MYMTDTKLMEVLESLEQILEKHYGDDWHYDFAVDDPGLTIKLTAGYCIEDNP
mgnify:CR=1 FL=1